MPVQKRSRFAYIVVGALPKHRGHEASFMLKQGRRAEDQVWKTAVGTFEAC